MSMADHKCYPLPGGYTTWPRVELGLEGEEITNIRLNGLAAANDCFNNQISEVADTGHASVSARIFIRKTKKYLSGHFRRTYWLCMQI